MPLSAGGAGPPSQTGGRAGLLRFSWCERIYRWPFLLSGATALRSAETTPGRSGRGSHPIAELPSRRFTRRVRPPAAARRSPDRRKRGARSRRIVAPAGYGKSTLLREWAERDRRPFVWLRLSGAAAELTPRAGRAAGRVEDVKARHSSFVLVVDERPTRCPATSARRDRRVRSALERRGSTLAGGVAA